MTRLPGAAILALALTAVADEPKKADRDARQTVESYLAAVLAGKVDAAAALALPGSSEGSKKRIEEYKELIAAKTIKVASSHASAKQGRAFVVTEEVKLARAQPDGRDKGPLLIKLSKKDGEWLVRDVDFKTEEAAKKELKQFLDRFPDARPEPEKQKK